MGMEFQDSEIIVYLRDGVDDRKPESLVSSNVGMKQRVRPHTLENWRLQYSRERISQSAKSESVPHKSRPYWMWLPDNQPSDGASGHNVVAKWVLK